MAQDFIPPKCPPNLPPARECVCDKEVCKIPPNEGGREKPLAYLIRIPGTPVVEFGHLHAKKNMNVHQHSPSLITQIVVMASAIRSLYLVRYQVPLKTRIIFFNHKFCLI